jgi:hypothetical protein
MISRGGHDWSDRFALIVSAALKLPQESFVIEEGGDLRAWPLGLRNVGLAQLLSDRSTAFSSRNMSGRHRRRSVPRRLQHEPRGHCLEALGPRLWLRPVQPLGENAEPRASDVQQGWGCVRSRTSLRNSPGPGGRGGDWRLAPRQLALRFSKGFRRTPRARAATTQAASPSPCRTGRTRHH